MTGSRYQHVILLASPAGCTASGVGASTKKPRHAGAVAVRSSGFPRAAAPGRADAHHMIELFLI